MEKSCNLNYRIKKGGRINIESFLVNSHMRKDTVFHEVFPHYEGRNVGILQMGPALEIYILEVSGNYKRGR